MTLIVLFVISHMVFAKSDVRRPVKVQSFEVVTSEVIIEGSDGPAFETNSEGSGTGTHIGNFTLVRRHCFTPPDHPAYAGDVIHNGAWKNTTANGDTLRGTCAGAQGQYLAAGDYDLLAEQGDFPFDSGIGC